MFATCSWLFYSHAAQSHSLLFISYALAGLSVGVVGAVPYVMVRAFPAAVRFSGISFSYNVAYAIFGGMTPIFVTLMMKWTPMAPAFYVLALCALGLVLGIYLQSHTHREVEAQAEQVGSPAGV